MYDLRLFLSKQGRIKYVSHLDMFRIMQRAVRRAEIPLWYTEGFNPHPYISFLLALSLTVEGLREPVDIRIVGETTPEELCRRLNAVFPEGLRVEEAAPPVHKPAEIALGEYTVTLDRHDLFAGELEAALASGALTCEKSGKKNGRKVVKTVNVSEHIHSFRVEETDHAVLLHVVLPAGSTFNLNPLQLMEGVSGYLGRTVTPDRTLRTRLLCADGTEFC